MERAKQLVRENGFLGIILPVSILTNSKIYIKTREIILKNFEIKALVELGKNTFMATNTKTVILFLKKANKTRWRTIKENIDNFFYNFKDMACNNTENIFSEYVLNTFEGLSIEDYINIFKGKITKILRDNAIVKEYQNKFGHLEDTETISKIIKIEKEKILYFILTFRKQIVLVQAGDDAESEKRFLGYEFSSRRGYEGIKIYPETLLYDDTDLTNESKVNSYILKNFKNEILTEPKNELSNHIKIAYLHELLDFQSIPFEKIINSKNVKKKLKFKKNWQLTELRSLLKNLEAGSRPKGGVKNIKFGIPSFGGEHINLIGGVDINNLRFVPTDYYQKSLEGRVGLNDILICKDGALTGKVGIIDKLFPFKEAMINEHLFILRTNEQIEQKYLYYFLLSDLGQQLLKSGITGQAQGGLNRQNLLKIRIPVPPKEIRQQIIKDLDRISFEQDIRNKKINSLRNEIKTQVANIQSNESVNLGKYISFEYGNGLPAEERIDGEYPVVGSNGIIGYHNEFLINGPAIIIGRKGSVGKINLIEKSCYPIDTTFWVKIDESKFLFKYSYYLLKSLNLESLNNGIGPGGLNRNIAYGIKIPLPKVEIQKAAIKKIEVSEEEINALTKKNLFANQEKKLFLEKLLLDN